MCVYVCVQISSERCTHANAFIDICIGHVHVNSKKITY